MPNSSKTDIVIIAHNLRSSHNVGALLRTADGIGVSEIFFTGYTPYPRKDDDDERMPHLTAKIDAQIRKTALGAETSQKWQHGSIDNVLATLKQQGYTLAALEQSAKAIPLHEYAQPEKIALLIGREVEGVEPELLQRMDVTLEIPMFGKKESFNVIQATAMALFRFRFANA